MQTPVEVFQTTEIPLLISESDLDPDILDELKTTQHGDQILGNVMDRITDAIPRAVLQRVVRVIPTDHFVITDVTLKFSLSGKLFGAQVSGDVSVKVAPKK